MRLLGYVGAALALLVSLVTGVGAVRSNSSAEKLEGVVVDERTLRSIGCTGSLRECGQTKVAVRYDVDGESALLEVSAGPARGWFRASYHEGQTVTLYRDADGDVRLGKGGAWHLPLVLLGVAVCLFLWAGGQTDEDA